MGRVWFVSGFVYLVSIWIRIGFISDVVRFVSGSYLIFDSYLVRLRFIFISYLIHISSILRTCTKSRDFLVKLGDLLSFLFLVI